MLLERHCSRVQAEAYMSLVAQCEHVSVGGFERFGKFEPVPLLVLVRNIVLTIQDLAGGLAVGIQIQDKDIDRGVCQKIVFGEPLHGCQSGRHPVHRAVYAVGCGFGISKAAAMHAVIIAEHFGIDRFFPVDFQG